MPEDQTVFIHIPGGSFVAKGSTPAQVYDTLAAGGEVPAYPITNDRYEGVVRLGPGFALTYGEASGK